MSPSQRPTIALQALQRHLEAQGWDVFRQDEGLLATTEDADGFYRLKADLSGRIYLRRTQPQTSSQGKKIVRQGRTYTWHRETQLTQEAMTTLEESDAFPQVLETLMTLVKSAP
jgi:hypothetical protein